jgi:hypothetical protein
MIVLAIFVAALTIGSTNVSAQTELAISSGLSTFADSSAGSTITEIGVTVNGWNISIIAAESHAPNLGPVDGLDISSLTVTCTSASCVSDPLTISFSGINFTQPVGANGFVTSYVLLPPSLTTTTQTAYVDTGNTYFGTGMLIGTISGDGTATGGGPAGPGAYSLTINDTFTTTDASGQTGFNTHGDIGATPEPNSMLLFGTGLLGIGGILRRRLV